MTVSLREPQVSEQLERMGGAKEGEVGFATELERELNEADARNTSLVERCLAAEREVSSNLLPPLLHYQHLVRSCDVGWATIISDSCLPPPVCIRARKRR